MLFRVFLIVATDIACWLPIIVLSFTSFLGYKVPEIVHSITSIVLLPINSLINPILYSRIDSTLFKQLKQVISMLRQLRCFSCEKVDNNRIWFSLFDETSLHKLN